MGIKEAKTIWFDGEYIPWGDANVHITAHALHYGSSVFEGIRAYETPDGPAIFRLSDHIDRLFDSAKIHRIAIPFTPEQVEEACRGIIVENGLASAYLRPLVFRGAESLGVTGADCPIQIAVIAFEWGAYLGEAGLTAGVDVGVSSWSRAAPNTFPAMAKAGGNYLSSQLVANEARRHGYAEGVALDHQGYVSEGSGENIFLVKKGKLFTPPVSAAILPGLTRDTVITLARERGYSVTEDRIPREALYVADEVFFTGTAAEITPVRSVDGIPIGAHRRGAITEQIQNDFFGLFDGRTADRWGWLDRVRAARPVAMTAGK
ncbi:MAG: branched-chain amino acid transaminase [Myxococcota bacterium]